MLSPASSILQQIELDLIRKDAHFYFEVSIGLSQQESSGVLIFGIIPYLSLFVIETDKFLSKSYLPYTHSLSSGLNKIVSAARMRTKFFDDTKKLVDGTFELLDWISEFHNEWHINAHRGVLAPLQKALQPDFGVFFYSRHITGTTHTGLFNVGYAEEDLPKISRDISKALGPMSHLVGKELGEFLGTIISLPDFTPTYSLPSHFKYQLQDDLLGYKDEKAKKYLDSIFNGKGTSTINLSLIYLLTQVNFLRHIFNKLVTGNPTPLFKLKYIVLYHLVSSLKKLQMSPKHAHLLSARSQNYLHAILDDAGLLQIATESKFRNILVHYGIGNVPESVLSLNTALYGLTEYFFKGMGYQDCSERVDFQLERISIILEEWLDWTFKQNQIRKWYE